MAENRYLLLLVMKLSCSSLYYGIGMLLTLLSFLLYHFCPGTGGEEASLFAMDIFRM